MTRGVVHDVRQVSRGWRWTRRPLPPASVVEPAGRHHTYPAPREFPTDWARSRPARAAREVILRGGLAPLIAGETRVAVEGLDVFDDYDGPAIICANHNSHLDTPLILCSLPLERQRRVAVGAAADYFFDVWWRALGSALAFATFPIERHGVGLSETPAKLLADGWSLVMFPEGTRSADGWGKRFRPGAASLAMATGVPLVPVAISGTFAAMPRGRGWPKPGRPPVRVRFGRPLHSRDGEDPMQFTDRLRGAIATLLDEDSTNWYAAARRAAGGSTPALDGPPVADWRRRWASTAGPKLTEGRPRAWR
jgi:1-acyl-sn-glycerol-3-phosphate acyltransferase